MQVLARGGILHWSSVGTEIVGRNRGDCERCARDWMTRTRAPPMQKGCRKGGGDTRSRRQINMRCGIVPRTLLCGVGLWCLGYTCEELMRYDARVWFELSWWEAYAKIVSEMQGLVAQTMGRPVTTLLSLSARANVQRAHGLEQKFPEF